MSSLRRAIKESLAMLGNDVNVSSSQSNDDGDDLHEPETKSKLKSGGKTKVMSSSKTVRLFQEDLIKEMSRGDGEGGQTEFIMDILQRLDEMNINLKILSETLIGVTVSKLKKYDGFDICVSDTARKLIKKWKSIAEKAEANTTAKTDVTIKSTTTSEIMTRASESAGTGIVAPGDHDYVFGRCNPKKPQYPGNETVRGMMSEIVSAYLATRKNKDKEALVSTIIANFQALGGRFLIQNPTTKKLDVVYDDSVIFSTLKIVVSKFMVSAKDKSGQLTGSKARELSAEKYLANCGISIDDLLSTEADRHRLNHQADDITTSVIATSTSTIGGNIDNFDSSSVRSRSGHGSMRRMSFLL